MLGIKNLIVFILIKKESLKNCECTICDNDCKDDGNCDCTKCTDACNS